MKYKDEQVEMWETNVPEFLKHDIDEVKKGWENPECTNLDCLLGEVYGSINAAMVDGLISVAQADYLRNKYFYGYENGSGEDDK